MYLVGIGQFFQDLFKKLNTPRNFRIRRKYIYFYTLVFMKIWYQGRFTKLTETRTYSVESIIYLLYIIATNFDSKKFGNLEEGESAIMI